MIMFGLNDSWIDEGHTTSRVSVEEYRKNLQQMARRSDSTWYQRHTHDAESSNTPKYPAERNRTLKPYVDVRACTYSRKYKSGRT